MTLVGVQFDCTSLPLQPLATPLCTDYAPRCRVMVRDDNSEREAHLHSGGECVVRREAVSLTLTIVACRRAGVRGATLVRDESGAALDPQNARVCLNTCCGMPQD